MIALHSLARLAATTERTAALVRCELCTAPIGDGHRHVVELGTHGVLCACHACAILFARSERGARYRTVPDRVRVDKTFDVAPERLGIPVGIAFVFCDSQREQVIACYPGPAGVVESELAPEALDALAEATSLTALLEPDVEALLLRGQRADTRRACYLVPITAAYELAGRLRRSWSGFSGGAEAERELAAFFDELDGRGEPA